YDYPVNYHKQLHGQCKQRSYGNVYHDSCKNYGSNEHIRMYSDEQMPCKHRLYPDKTYNMHHGKAEKDHVNYIQVVSTPGHGGYCGEKQLYYNNYQIKVPEFVDKSNGGRKPYVNTMKDSSYWNKIYPCYPYSRDTYMKWMYSGGTNSIWGFSDTHLPYRRPNPRHFGSAEYLNRKAGCIDQIALHNRDAPCHRYPLSEPNDISWEVPTRRIRNNISMPNIGSQFKRQNNMNYPCRPHNAIDPLYHKASFMNLPVPTTTIKGSIYGVESANRRLNDDSVSLFCDDSFSSSCYEGRDIESPRVILSRNINSINQLAPHSVTENLYISNDIEVIDTKNSKSPHDSEKKIQEMHKNHKNEKSNESKTSSQALNKDIDKKITFSDLKGLQDQVYCANDPQTQLKYAKKLIQVASDLSNDNMKDTKFVKKNKEKYLSDAYSIIKGLVNSSSPYPEAMFFLANCYGDGTFGLPIDHKQAYTLYYSASKYKHSQSIYRTAVCLEIGMGVKKNQEKAVQYYQKAASLGNVKAMYKIGIILLNGLLKQTKNPKKAIFWLKKASELADEENPHALHELAILYEKDNEGICIVTRDEKHSFELYTKAAHLMYPPSQVRLAYAYEHGVLGCDVDPKKSITWYSRAAEKGNPDAELGLSGWYLTGAEGVLEQSDREAYLWAKKAAEKGKGLVRAIERLYELKKLGSNSKIPDKIYNRWQLTRMFDC
ncbi:unnamed protein product, partial [Pneumocystis jirovecii]